MSQNAELSKGLVFHCKLDEWDGTRDIISGISGVGTAIYPVLDRQGSGRRWLDFDGVNDYVELPSITISPVTDAMSVIVKIKIGAVMPNNTVIFCGEASGSDRCILQIISSKISFATYDGGASWDIINGYQTLLVNTEYVIAITKNAGQTGTKKVYVNAIDVTTPNVVGTASSGGAGGFHLGSDTVHSANFSGSISLLRIFNYSLTAQQIANYSKPEYPIEWVDRGAGINVVVNGGFDNALTWGKDANWSIADGVATSNGSGNMTQNIGSASVAGRNYTLKFDILNYSSGQVKLDGYTYRSGNGTYSQRITSPFVNHPIAYVYGNSFIGSIDNFSVISEGCILDLNSEGLARYSDGSYNTGYWTDKTNQLTATINGATVVIPPASNLGATMFNGTTSKVDFGDQLQFTLPNDQFTISCWINPLVTTYFMPLAKFSSSSYAEYTTQISLAGAIYIFLFDSGGVTNYSMYKTADGVISSNVNYHLAYVFKNGAMTIYLNSVIIANTKTNTGSGFSAFSNTVAPLVIGEEVANSRFSCGLISNVRLYSRGFTQDEIQLLNDSNS